MSLGCWRSHFDPHHWNGKGAHLPEESQPKGFFESGLNRIAASITTELGKE